MLTGLGDHGQRLVGVCEEGRPAAEVTGVLEEELGEGAHAEPGRERGSGRGRRRRDTGVTQGETGVIQV